VAIDLHEATATWQRQGLATGVAGLVTLSLLGVVGMLLVRRDLRPLEQVTAAAEEISQGDLTRRVEVTRVTNEVGRLGTAFNTMVASIESAFSEQQRSELKLRRFVADASHELRTPLTSIRGYAELERVGGADTPDKRATVMRNIEREATRMGGLVEDLLLLAKLDEEPPLRLTRVDLARLAEDAVNDLHAVEPDRPVQTLLTQPVEVVADEARLRQVLANLLANVRAHTPAGTPVEVALERQPETAVLRVVDHGPGVPPDKVDMVFERFARLDPSRARTSGGSGLGLAIVRALVEAHHGTVAVLPTPGGGATFVVTLPLSRPVPPSEGADGEMTTLREQFPGNSQQARVVS
jgi:two-component system OmpR family sensor kinase